LQGDAKKRFIFMSSLIGKHIVLGLTGGIACYKAALLCRALIKEGASVQVVMTPAAEQFITPMTMQALSGRAVYTSQWDARQDNHMPHINLSRQADAILIAPASADFMAKLVHGQADDLLSLMCLARPRGESPLELAHDGQEDAALSVAKAVPLLIAPAMNREMWSHPATQRNLLQLARDGAHLLGVGSGFQACGETGDGRMLEPEQVLAEVIAFFQPKLLPGKHVVITAGPTYEAIDPVRGITNLSSGKMGFAIAQAAHEAGAQVTLIAGPVHLAAPRGVNRVDVRSAREMLVAVEHAVQSADVLIACAAVADWRPAQAADQKIKKDGSGQPTHLSFVENPDILATIAKSERAKAGALYCVGFAAESENLEENAKNKRIRKGVALLVGNIGPSTFGQDDNALVLVDAGGTREIARAPKLQLARLLVAEIASRLSGFSSISQD
jgi:phosphopantothenoylcysteine decarboxylase / phosphopantothenate---cysteine ligase